MPSKLISKQLVSSEYRDLLRRDLEKTTVCRFLVAYVSLQGLSAITSTAFLRALRHQESFGVASISCACGYAPLLNLQQQLGQDFPPRLKYFMDPVVKPDEEPAISLFHSKLVYLFLERERKSVVYIGSHNWTGRALGPGTPRNAEASIRFELDFAPEHLDGTGTSLPAEVNRHLMDAWNAPVCYPATPASELAFQQWIQKVCKRAPRSPGDDVTVILAVCKTPPQPSDWLNLQDAGIYVQALDEDEGRRVYDSSEVLLLVWNSRASLAAADQPFILRCRQTSRIAGPNSELAGNNVAQSPMEGFKAVVLDDTKLVAMQQGARANASPTKLWSGRYADVFDFEFPTLRTRSAQVDGAMEPIYQVYMQTEAVVFPANKLTPPRARYAWEREAFAMAKNRNAARLEKAPGYYASQGTTEHILTFLQDILHVRPEEALVLPYFAADVKVGKRVAQHPLHDTYIGPDSRSSRADFYAKSKPGMLVPEIDEGVPEMSETPQRELIEQPLPRVQRVFTMPIKDLCLLWSRTAEHLRAQDPEEEK